MRSPHRMLCRTVCTMTLIFGCGTLRAATFTPLGDLAGGDFDSVTTDVSDDGQTVVGFSISDLGTEAFRWTPDTGIVALSSITGEAVPTIARAVSDSGTIAGQLDFTEEQCSVDATIIPQAALWTEDFGFLGVGGPTLYAHDLSADGTAAAGTTCEFFVDSETGESFEVERPYHWTQEAGAFILGHRGEAFGISADGNTIAGFGPIPDANGDFFNQAFLWSPDLEEPDFAVPLAIVSGTPAPQVSEAYDISANGEVIVGAYIPEADAMVEGFRWTEQTGFEGLGHLAEFPSFVFDVSDDGGVVVGEQWLDDAGEEVFATVWDSVNGLRDLKALLSEDADLAKTLESWTLIRGNGISADGRSIVGFGTNPDGNQEGWLVVLDDDPPPPILTGDYNDNGTVEQADLDFVLLNWGADATTPPEGWTNDLPSGNIDQDELDGVLLNWGNTAMAGLGTAAAVPEPATLALAGLMLTAAVVCRRMEFGA